MASPSARTASSPGQETTTLPDVATTGEVLDDGTIIDLVRSDTGGLSLVVSTNGHKPKYLPQVEHRGRVYVPATLDTDYLKLMQLPARASSPGPIAELFNSMKALIQQSTGIELQFARVAAYFAMATWFSDVF